MVQEWGLILKELYIVSFLHRNKMENKREVRDVGIEGRITFSVNFDEKYQKHFFKKNGQ